MKLAVCSDLHLGNHSAFSGVEVGRMDYRCRLIVGCLEAAVEKTMAAGCDYLVVAGDVFDNDHPFPDLLAAVLGIFLAAKKRGLTILPMVGNHDQHSNTPNDHALSIFRYDFEVAETPTFLSCLPSLFLVPFGYDPLSWDSAADIVVAHHGISDTGTLPAKASGTWVRKVEDIRTWMKRTSTKLYLSGDWHEHRIWDSGKICQIGALAPVNWTNRAYMPGKPDPYGSLLIIGSQGIERIVIPGPRFMRAQSVGEARDLLQRTAAEGCVAYIDLIQDSSAIPEDMVGFVKVSSAAGSKYEAVASAVKEVVSDASVEEQVLAYIEADQEIPEGYRARVADMVLRTLKEAKCQN